jgi:hypothetical protein
MYDRPTKLEINLVERHRRYDDSPAPTDLLKRLNPHIKIMTSGTWLFFEDGPYQGNVKIKESDRHQETTSLSPERFRDFQLAEIKRRYNETGQLSDADMTLLRQLSERTT